MVRDVPQRSACDNTYTGLVVAHLTLNLPIGIWLMSVFVREIPIELEEAARVDGCTTPQMLLSASWSRWSRRGSRRPR